MKTKRILIRAGVTPYQAVSYERLRHLMGDNLGNLVYANGIFRALNTDDSVEIVPTRYKYDFSNSEITRINEEYDAFIIPLADAIRRNFIPEFLSLAAAIRKLTIPVVVLGCGIRAPYEPGRSEDLFLNFAAKCFFSAVLEHSAKIGVRGEITGDYLKQLGFREELDYTVIGCPSIYTWGKAGLPVRDSWKRLLDDPSSARISYNLSQGSAPAHIHFIRENAKRFDDAVYLPQRGEELELMYAGVPFPPPAAEGFPLSLADPLYQDGDVRMYGSVSSWLSFLRSRDFSFGTRMHGNVAALLAGTPALFCPFDARTRELALYHSLPHIAPEELEQEAAGLDTADLIGIAAKKDFRSHLSCYSRNFAHYVDFLDENGLQHIYHEEELNPVCECDAEQDGQVLQFASDSSMSDHKTEFWELKETAHDRKVAAVRQLPPLIPITRTDRAEMARRLGRYYEGVFVKKTSFVQEANKTVKKVLKKLPLKKYNDNK